MKGRDIAWACVFAAQVLGSAGAMAGATGELWETRMQLEQAGQPFGPETVQRNCRAPGAEARPTLPLPAMGAECPAATVERSGNGFRLHGQCHGKRYAAETRRVSEDRTEGRIEAEMEEGRFTARLVERRVGRCDPASFVPGSSAPGVLK